MLISGLALIVSALSFAQLDESKPDSDRLKQTGAITCPEGTGLDENYDYFADQLADEWLAENTEISAVVRPKGNAVDSLKKYVDRLMSRQNSDLIKSFTRVDNVVAPGWRISACVKAKSNTP